MNSDELLFKFKEHLAVLNRSPSTIENYTDHLKSFLDTLKKTEIMSVTRSMIESYIAGLYDHRTQKGKPYSLSSWRHQTSSLSILQKASKSPRNKRACLNPY
jgi:site-specific recombinase XerD